MGRSNTSSFWGCLGHSPFPIVSSPRSSYSNIQIFRAWHRFHPPNWGCSCPSTFTMTRVALQALLEHAEYISNESNSSFDSMLNMPSYTIVIRSAVSLPWTIETGHCDLDPHVKRVLDHSTAPTWEVVQLQSQVTLPSSSKSHILTIEQPWNRVKVPGYCIELPSRRKLQSVGFSRNKTAKTFLLRLDVKSTAISGHCDCSS